MDFPAAAHSLSPAVLPPQIGLDLLGRSREQFPESHLSSSRRRSPPTRRNEADDAGGGERGEIEGG